MATTFNSNSLSVLGYANGFTLWHYKSDSSASVTIRSSFWPNLEARKILRHRDMIILDCSDNFVIGRVSVSNNSISVVSKKVNGG